MTLLKWKKKGCLQFFFNLKYSFELEVDDMGFSLADDDI